MSVKKKIITKTLSSKTIKPDTVTRAGITANLKFTRGKQLVEHDPFTLIPDPQNPRPGELIDDEWLIKYLRVGKDDSLCAHNPVTNEYHIPEFHELRLEPNDKLEESYNFLRGLANSIRQDGVIEPIEVFLADKNNDPDYFKNSSLDYGYVILEGHQRRLAAMMAGVSSVTCIELTDETMLAKLKVKHRKLRRQLSENNLRKGLTVSQNYQIVRELLNDTENQGITTKELSSVIGLNEGIASALKSICINQERYPSLFVSMILDNKLTFKAIRQLVPKSYDEIEETLKNGFKNINPIKKSTVKARGRNGGAIKRSATFKVKNEIESLTLQRFLLSRFPELNEQNDDALSFASLERLLNRLKEIAIKSEV